MSTLAERIEWILQNRGFSKRGLSLAAGLSQSHVGQLARGTLSDQVSASTLAAIARAARVDPLWLQTGEGGPDPLVEEAPAPDPLPRRAHAAHLAREHGVYEGAVVSVLGEPPDERNAQRSVLWWALRMMAREVELFTGRAPGELTAPGARELPRGPDDPQGGPNDPPDRDPPPPTMKVKKAGM